ncbi:hypothetical protein [Kibdelosporangium aridum]|uniref:hypothetical protein n=1 Tax=Kibdelosporangium aridum TaxID=2030 RepID=UPI000A006991|nr:hypothetical protein [Kibdelosporangium aridum]
MRTDRPFRPDDVYDRDQASDGVSRYGAYLARHRGKFLDFDEQPTTGRLEFAANAWRVASSPIMAPPYVKSNPRVQSAEVMWDEFGHMAVDVVIGAKGALTLPRELRYKARGWQRDSLSPRRWFDPQDPQHLTVLPMVLVRVPITLGDLPEPVYRDTATPETLTAKDAVWEICAMLNRVVAGVLDGLD